MTAATINGKKPKFFTTPIADSGTKTDIPATGGDDTVSQQQGFPSKFSTPRGSGGKSVGRSDMNGLFNGVSSLNYYFQFTGRNPWVSGQSYPKGAKVWHEGTTAEYVSTKDDNTDTPGASGVTTWIKLNDLSGTSGGGTTVDCAWSSRASEIGGLLSNAGKIPGLETKVNALTGDVSTLKTDVSTLKTSVNSVSAKINTLQESINVLKSGTQFSLDGFSGFNYTHTNDQGSGQIGLPLAPTVMALPGWLIGCRGVRSNTGDHSLGNGTILAETKATGQVALSLPTCYVPAGTMILYADYNGTTVESAMIKYDFSGVSFPSSATKSYELSGMPGVQNLNVDTTKQYWHQASTSKIAKIKISIPEYTGSSYAVYSPLIGYSSDTKPIGPHGYFIQGTTMSGSGYYTRTYPKNALTMEFIVPANCWYTIGVDGSNHATSLTVEEYVRSN